MWWFEPATRAMLEEEWCPSGLQALACSPESMPRCHELFLSCFFTFGLGLEKTDACWVWFLKALVTFRRLGLKTTFCSRRLGLAWSRIASQVPLGLETKRLEAHFATRRRAAATRNIKWVFLPIFLLMVTQLAAAPSEEKNSKKKSIFGT